MERSIPAFGSNPGKKQKGEKKGSFFKPDFEILDCETEESICIIEVKKLYQMPWSKHQNKTERSKN